MNRLYKERFLRNIGIMDEADLARIHDMKIAIGGLGLGGAIFLNLVRMGFQHFHVADPDTYERTNANRQRMAKEPTYGMRKDDALIAEAVQINPDVEIIPFRDGVQEDNADMFVNGMDWVVDTVDVYAMNEKLALNEAANRRGIPVASCGAIGFGASVIIFDETTPTFAEVSGMSRDNEAKVNLDRFLKFITPGFPDYMQAQMDKAAQRTSHIPFVSPGVEISAAFAVAEIGKQVLGMGERVRAPFGIHIDPIQVRIQRYDCSYQVHENVGKISRVA